MTHEMTVINELATLRDQNPEIEFVDAIIPDLNGFIRGKRFPIKDAAKICTSGVQIPESVVLLDFFGESSDPVGRGFSDGDPDGTLRPISGTIRPVPWGDGNKAQVLMRLESDDGSLCSVDPRTVGARVVDQFNELGYRVNIAFELEFYLLDAELDSRGCPQFPGANEGEQSRGETQVYLLDDLDKYDEFLRKVAHVCDVQDIPASVITSEYSPSQFEINLNHVQNPLQAADQCILLKRAIQGVALDFGMRATFMPKPFIDYSGSGMHIHLSLENDQGQNVFCGESELGSKLLHNAIGGLLETLPDVFAIFAPGRNSYRRFVPDLYVPVNKTWGYNNRSVTIRIPSGEDHARRLEHRVAGADANPYLVLAALLGGVHYGITQAIDPGEASLAVNVSGQIDGSIPFEWESALNRLHESTFAESYLSREYVDLFCALKRDELRQYREHVSEQEYLLYL